MVRSEKNGVGITKVVPAHSAMSPSHVVADFGYAADSKEVGPPANRQTMTKPALFVRGGMKNPPEESVHRGLNSWLLIGGSGSG